MIYFNRKSWEIYIYQLGFTGAVQFRDGTLDPSDVRVKCPISELGAIVNITNSNIIIKISHPKQWESDSAHENHTLLCNITLKINELEKLRLRFRDGTIRLPIRVNVPSLNQSPVLGLNIEFMTSSRVIR